ncbi:LamB/YcsF family protein [Candidatus Thioglobus sp.]|nr:LamB/YcsF family protein [Candidatus Thioglobus sp.]
MINCDLGECLTPNPDIDIMPLINMANIACGGHAGDNNSMIKTIQLAKKFGVKIGAHPSYADMTNFGRVSQTLSSSSLFDLIYQQITTFQTLCTEHGALLKYIKPHGALYHDITHNPLILEVMCDVIHKIDQNLSLVVLAGHEDYFKNFGNNKNGLFLHEVYADRGYQGLQMIPRGSNGAVLTDPKSIIDQYYQFLEEKSFKIDTICFHSDNKASVDALKQLKNA